MNAIAPTRRHVLLATLSAAGGLAVAALFPETADALPTGPTVWDAAQPAGAQEISAWVVIEPDNTVLIRVAKQEMGQGVLTSLAMLVAEELECDWARVRVEYASPHRNVVEKAIYGRMGTGGSSSVRGSFSALQQAGASARERLIAAAAIWIWRWGMPSSASTALRTRLIRTC